MKKIACIVLVAATLVGGAFAQGSISLGLGYARDAYVSKTFTIESTASIDALCLDIQAFLGRDIGFYTAFAVGLPVGGAVKTGSFSSELAMEDYSTKVHLNGVVGAGFSMASGPLGITLGGGLGYSYSKFVSEGGFLSATSSYSTGGLGFGLALSYRLNADMALQASLHGLYGLFTFDDERKDSFVSGLTLTPAVGLRMRLR